MSEIELKPCPCCGSEHVEVALYARRRNIQYYIVCIECFIKTNIFDTEREAIDCWNTRKPMERIIERLEELEIMNKNLAEENMTKPYSMGNSIKSNMYLDRMTGVHDAIEIVKEVGVTNEKE